MPDNGENRKSPAQVKRRAVRNIERSGAASPSAAPYAYKRETKQQAAARIERELRKAAGMSDGGVRGGGDIADCPDPEPNLTGDTKVFNAIDHVRAEHVRHVAVTDAAAAQREINAEIERRRHKRRVAYRILIAAVSVFVLTLIILIAAKVLR